jgi:hypothetical protein
MALSSYHVRGEDDTLHLGGDGGAIQDPDSTGGRTSSRECNVACSMSVEGASTTLDPKGPGPYLSLELLPSLGARIYEYTYS